MYQRYDAPPRSERDIEIQGYINALEEKVAELERRVEFLEAWNRSVRDGD